MEKDILIYQWKNWEILLKEDTKNDTILANQKQISEIFNVNSQAITKHIKNIFEDWELNEKQTCSILEQVQEEWNKIVKRKIKYYNIDLIISVWYRINSIKATEFRKWATKTLKQHITEGFTINPKRLEKNYDKFMKAVDDVKLLLPKWWIIKTEDILELVKSFANTWFNLESYDEDKLPLEGFTIKKLKINSDELYSDVEKLKTDLISKWQATDLFAQEKTKKSLEWILWNIFQTFDWLELYPTLEEKAAHLLYFVVKNHPFTDWNKRTWAFAFIWFLNKIWFNFRESITPEALTVITLLVAESNPKDKERIIGLIILLLKN